MFKGKFGINILMHYKKVSSNANLNNNNNNNNKIKEND